MLEVRIHARAKPGFLLTPLQPFGQQDLADPAALHADARLAEVSHQTVQRPAGERQVQISRSAQCGGDDRTALFGRVGRRAPRAPLLLQPGQTPRVEPLEPEPNRGLAYIQRGRDLRRAQPINRVLDNLRPAHQARTQRPRARHAPQVLGLSLVQIASPKRHRPASAQSCLRHERPTEGKVATTCRMHHLAAASVGIAMGGGTDVALETADAALLKDRVLGVVELIRLSRATLANIWQNITLALGLKGIFLVTTLFGVTTLWMAILADTGATV